MKLIYLVIGNINRNICNIDFSFSCDFICEYKDKVLTIKKIIEYNPISYSHNILSIHAIVGKNGSGKSSILSLLGLNRTDRFNYFSTDMRDKDIQWFAIYHLEDNKFAIEGNDIKFSPYSISSKFAPQAVQNFYSIKFKYSFNDNKIVEESVCFIQNIDNCEEYNLHLTNSIFFTLFQNDSYPNWYYQQNKFENNGVYDLGFKRFYRSSSLGKYALLGKLFFNLLNNKKSSEPLTRLFGMDGFDVNSKLPVSVSISLKKFRDEQSFLDEIANLDKKLFPQYGWANNTSPFQEKKISHAINKQIFILKFLESTLYIVFDVARKKNQNISIDPDDVSDYQSQKNILIEKINILINRFFSDNFEHPFIVKHGDNHIPKEFNDSLNYFCNSLEAISSNYFTDDSCINYDFYESNSYELDRFLRFIDFSISNNLLYPLDFSYYFNITFNGLSAGQIALFNFIASLYERIQNMQELGYEKGATCILLLDEPDLSFHPEWSRRFIYCLTQFLSLDEFNNFHYQIIIATHSPFLLSDIETNNCICLTEDNGSIKKSSPNQAFLARLDDLMVDTFFVDSIFGEFSERYVNCIIEDIQKYLNNPSCVTSKKIKTLENKIRKISNETVRHSLILKLSQIKNATGDIE